MGVVVEATHLQLDERFALKFLHRSASQAKDLVSRFSQEARAAAKLKSEYVARVIDVGAREDGAPYIVMEYLEGADLGQILSTQGPLPIADAVEFVVQACEAVAEAHARGIVHRDLKPENLFCVQRDDGRRFIKVLDFGISKANLTGRTSDVDVASHDTTTLMGSPFYMSPEQLRSTKTVDHRADLWSLGTTLFEILTGTTAFDHEKQFTELVAEILESPHRRLRAFRADAPEELERIVDRCLEKDRDKRFNTAAELAIALLPLAPRRARGAAERATALMRAAGLTDPNLKLPPSQFPPPPSSGDPRSISGVISMERGSLLPSSVPFSTSTTTANASAGLRATSPSAFEPVAEAAPQKKSSKGVVLIAVVGALLLGGIAWFLLQGREAPTATEPSPQPPASTQVAAPPTFTAPSPTAEAVHPAPSTEATGEDREGGTEIVAQNAANASANHPAGPRAPIKPILRNTTKPTVPSATTSAAPSTDLEIRRER